MCASPLSVSQQSCLSGLLVSYVRVFGAKLCCFEDVTPYLSSLRTQASQDVKAALIQQLTQVRTHRGTHDLLTHRDERSQHTELSLCAIYENTDTKESTQRLGSLFPSGSRVLFCGVVCCCCCVLLCVSVVV